MSEQVQDPQAEAAAAADALQDFTSAGDAGFGQLMDFLVADEAAASGTASTAETLVVGGEGEGAGTAAAVPAGTPTPGADPADSGAGTDPAVSAVPAAAPPADAGGRPVSWTVPAAEVIGKFGDLATGFENSVAAAHQATALDAVREEYTAYFTAIEQPASMLVGKEVPNPSGEGMLTLRDTASAREWQDATKYILVEEIKGRAVKSMDEQSDFLTTVHASIELFQKNSDLIPGTKDFDMDLADRVTKVLTPYILKVDDKIVGYNIPTQPLIDHAREQLIAERAAAPTPPPPAVGGTEQPGAASPPAAPPSTTPAAPQAGIPSKAGAGEQAEDFSTLFGTIGMPEFRI